MEHTDKGSVTTPLYSGPNREAVVSFPVGKFDIYAEIHEEAEAYKVTEVKLQLPIIMPEEDDYYAFNLENVLSTTYDTARLSQFLRADVRCILFVSMCGFSSLFLLYLQASIRKYACWFDMECVMQEQFGGELSLEDVENGNLTESQQEQVDELTLLVTDVSWQKGYLAETLSACTSSIFTLFTYNSL